MCHLCRKIETIRGVDSKATKPILVALSKLHKHVEPRLGDLWLWRHDETLKLRKLLGVLYKTVPVAPLKAMLEDIDHDMDHIKTNMADHPPRRSTGRWDSLKTSITPSESPSIMVYKEIQLEAERRKRDKHIEKEHSRRRHDARPDSCEKELPELPELPGSDINPPGARIQQSIELVEEWFRRCDVLMSVEGQKDFENRSIVSIIGGGVKERPDIDVGVWRKGSVYSRRGISSIISIHSGSHPYKLPITQLSSCVYDKPSHKLDLNMRILGKVTELAGRKAKYRYQNNLASLLQRKKAEKLSKRHNISVNQAIQRLKAHQSRKERMHLMSGGRSLGPSPITSLESIANTSQGRTSIDRSTVDLISLTAGEVERCIEKVGTETKVDHYSNSASSSLMSSRASATNFGSLIQQSPVASREAISEYQEFKRPVRDSSSLSSSRSSVVNFGSMLNLELSSKDELLKRIYRPRQPTSRAAQQDDPSSQQHIPAPPAPIGRPLSLDCTDQQIPRRPIQATQNEDEYNKLGGKASQGPNAPTQDRNKATPRDTEGRYEPGDYELSRAFQNRKRRCAERNETAPKDTTQEKKNISHSKTSERESKTPKTYIDPEYVRTEAEVVSQAVQNSRRRRAAENSRAPMTDRYHNEERQKFWNPAKPQVDLYKK